MYEKSRIISIALNIESCRNAEKPFHQSVPQRQRRCGRAPNGAEYFKPHQIFFKTSAIFRLATGIIVPSVIFASRLTESTLLIWFTLTTIDR